MKSDVTHLVVLCTCPGSITAKNIAQRIVEEKLAACCNIISDIQSHFRWVNKVDSANEYLLIIKTTTGAYDELERRIKAMHPHELPEIIAVPIYSGLEGYLDWVTNSTKT